MAAEIRMRAAVFAMLLVMMVVPSCKIYSVEQEIQQVAQQENVEAILREQQSVASNLYNQAEIFALADDLKSAARLYREGQELLEELLTGHPEHHLSGEWRYALAKGWLLRGDLALPPKVPLWLHQAMRVGSLLDDAISHYHKAAEEMALLLAREDVRENPHWLFEAMQIESALAAVVGESDRLRHLQRAHAIKVRLMKYDGLLSFNYNFRHDLVHDLYETRGEQDELVFDRVTELEWQRCSVGQTWNPDRQRCEGEAARFRWDEAVVLVAPGGFRLPTIYELQTLVYCTGGVPVRTGMIYDRNACRMYREKPTIYGVKFSDTPRTWFWSSSPCADNANCAYGVSFIGGGVDWDGKDSSYRVRLVRTGK